MTPLEGEVERFRLTSRACLEPEYRIVWGEMLKLDFRNAVTSAMPSIQAAEGAAEIERAQHRQMNSKVHRDVPCM